MHATACLYTVVQNTTGVSRHFGFLPPHGVTLAPGAHFKIFGSIIDAMGGVDYAEKKRKIAGFEAALAAGDLVVLHTPRPILQGPGNSVKMLDISDVGALQLVDPCFFGTTSESL